MGQFNNLDVLYRELEEAEICLAGARQDYDNALGQWDDERAPELREQRDAWTQRVEELKHEITNIEAGRGRTGDAA